VAVAHHRLSLGDVFRRASGKGLFSELQDLHNLLYFLVHSYFCLESFDVRFVSGVFFVCEFLQLFFSCRRSSVCCDAELRSWSLHVKEGFVFSRIKKHHDEFLVSTALENDSVLINREGNERIEVGG
jgi:hypothetical protein